MSQDNPYNGRMRWWYESISDLMLAHPEWSQQDIAARLAKNPNTIGLIMKADTFRSFHNQRRADFRDKLNDRILGKTAEIAALGLEIIHDKMKKSRDGIALPLLLETTGDALDRLGFGAKNPAVQINNFQQNNDQRTVALPSITQVELLEAQAALRRAEHAKLVTSLQPQLIEHEDANDDSTLTAE